MHFVSLPVLAQKIPRHTHTHTHTQTANICHRHGKAGVCSCREAPHRHHRCIFTTHTKPSSVCFCRHLTPTVAHNDCNVCCIYKRDISPNVLCTSYSTSSNSSMDARRLAKGFLCSYNVLQCSYTLCALYVQRAKHTHEIHTYVHKQAN